MGIDERCTKHFETHRVDILRRLQTLDKEMRDRGEPQYHVDFVFLGALRRSFSLTCGFFDLVAAENYVCAAPLVRLQLDNAIRTVACLHVPDVEEFMKHVAGGKRIDQLRDKKGNRLTDRHIINHLVEQEEVPWVLKVYQDGCKFVHLSDVHLFRLTGGSHELPEKERIFSEVEFVILVETFVMATELFYVFIEYWLRLRAAPGTDPQPQLPLPEDDTLEGHLKAILRQYGLIPCSYEQMVLVDGQIWPSMKISIDQISHVGDVVSLQIDIDVMLNRDQILCESFAGMGLTQSAARDEALHNFSIATMPVLRVALWKRRPTSPVVVEQWDISGQVWRATIGGDLVRARDPKSVRIPKELNDLLKVRLAEKLKEGPIHWLRVFYSNLPRGAPTVEVLLDNESWEESQDAIGHLSWDQRSEFYSMRRFLILQRSS